MEWTSLLPMSASGDRKFDGYGVDDELMNYLLTIDDPSITWACANNLKEEGNGWFRKNEFDLAYQCYSKAMDVLLLDVHVADEDENAFRRLALSLNMNLAACLLKTNDYERVIRLCSLVLKYDNRNVKALYRRAVASINLGMLEKAHKDLIKAKEICSDDKDILKELGFVQSHLNLKASCVTNPQNQVHDIKGKRLMRDWEVGESSIITGDLPIEDAFHHPEAHNHFSSCPDDIGNSSVPMEWNVDVIGSESVSSNSVCDMTDQSTGPSNSNPDNCIESPVVKRDVKECMFRFVNRRRRDSLLKISAAQYKKLADGNEVYVYHPVHKTIMKVRVSRMRSKELEDKEDIDCSTSKKASDVKDGKTHETLLRSQGNFPTGIEPNGLMNLESPDVTKMSYGTSVLKNVDFRDELISCGLDESAPCKSRAQETFFKFSSRLKAQGRSFKAASSLVVPSYKRKISNRVHGSNKRFLSTKSPFANKIFECRCLSGQKRKQGPAYMDHDTNPSRKKRFLSSFIYDNCLLFGPLDVEDDNSCN